MRDQLAKHGVDVSGLVVDDKYKTGLSVIMSRGSDRAILTYAGAISELRFEEMDLRLLERARHLHLGSYFMLNRLQPRVPNCLPVRISLV